MSVVKTRDLPNGCVAVTSTGDDRIHVAAERALFLTWCGAHIQATVGNSVDCPRCIRLMNAAGYGLPDKPKEG